MGVQSCEYKSKGSLLQPINAHVRQRRTTKELQYFPDNVLIARFRLGVLQNLESDLGPQRLWIICAARRRRIQCIPRNLVHSSQSSAFLAIMCLWLGSKPSRLADEEKETPSSSERGKAGELRGSRLKPPGGGLCTCNLASLH
jgi:hypothetical protein